MIKRHNDHDYASQYVNTVDTLHIWGLWGVCLCIYAAIALLYAYGAGYTTIMARTL
jgi:hypothetical protein